MTRMTDRQPSRAPSASRLAGLLVAGLILVAAISAASPARAQGGTAVANHPTPAQITQLRGALLALPLAPGNGLLDAVTTPDLPDTTSIVQSRSVSIDKSYLAEMLAADDLRVANGSIASQSVAFVVDLFANFSVRAVKLRSATDELGHTIWRGIVVAPSGDGEMTMVVNGGAIVADLRVGNRSFRIQPMGNVERVVEYDHGSLPHPSTDALTPDHSGDTPVAPSAPGAQAAAPGAPVTVNVLVAYTAAATAALGAGNESTQISAAIADLNQTLANSGVGNVTVVITGIVPTTYIEPPNGTSNQILTDLRNGAGDLARIQQLRKTQNADLVQLWTMYSDACGLAYLLDDLDKMPNGVQADYGSGFSTVSMVNNLSCLGVSEGTAAHEIGHNLGLNHDRFVMPNAVPGPTGYNYGYVDTVGLFQDTMAYGDQCTRLNIRCPRGQYFSNPNVNYTSATMGQRPTGVPDAQAGAADNARRVGELAPLVAQFRTVGGTAAAPPQSLVASVLPGGRSVLVNSPATVFAAMINTSAFPLDGCSVLGPANAAAGLSFSYQTTNPNNALVGLPNTFTSLGPNAAQNFLLVLQSSVPQQIAAGALMFQCAGVALAPSIVGVNTLDLTVSATPIADIIALAATATNNGTLSIPFSTNTAGAFSVASANVGAVDTITVRADTGSATLPLTLTLCQTNPSTAACLAAPAATVTTQIASGTTPTFSIFATATAQIPFAPATSRIFVRFFDQSGGGHGSTSVAVQTQ